jgi:hypothetical protein
LDGSVPDLRRQLAGLLAGVIVLGEFQRWYWTNYTAIEQRGSDEDVDLLLLVFNRLAEYTSDYIDASELLDALRTDPLVQHELQPRRTAVA